jgi:hypothetical protein
MKINLGCILGGILDAKKCNIYIYKESERNQLGDISKW